MTGYKNGGYFTAIPWSSIDGGATWVQIGKGATSQALTVSPIGIRFDPKNSSIFWVFGYFAGSNGALFKTTDGGNTFIGVHPTGMSPNETEDVSIDSASNTVLVTEHERNQSLYRSTDGGQTWASIGGNIPTGTAHSQYTHIINSNTYLVACSFAIDGAWDTGGGTTGIYRTTDGGATWNSVAPNYEVFGSPTEFNGTLYWGYYNGSDGGIIKSVDSGVTWSVLDAKKLEYSVIPAVLASGHISSVSTSKQAALFTQGSGTQTTLSPVIALNSVFGLVYNPIRNALFAWEMNGGIERLDLQ